MLGLLSLVYDISCTHRFGFLFIRIRWRGRNISLTQLLLVFYVDVSTSSSGFCVTPFFSYSWSPSSLIKITLDSFFMRAFLMFKIHVKPLPHDLQCNLTAWCCRHMCLAYFIPIKALPASITSTLCMWMDSALVSYKTPYGCKKILPTV